MKDAFGNDVNIGDTIAFGQLRRSYVSTPVRSPLTSGKIEKITKTESYVTTTVNNKEYRLESKYFVKIS